MIDLGDQTTVCPVWSDDHSAIYHGDSRKLFPLLGTGRWADLILTDVPYDARTHEGARTNPNWHLTGGNEGAKLITFAPVGFDQLRADFGMIGQAARGWVISFVDFHHAVYLEDSPPHELRYVRTGVWVKPNAAPQFSGDRPAQGWESVAVMESSPTFPDESGMGQWSAISLLHKEGGRMKQYEKRVSKAVWTHNIAGKPKGGRPRHAAEKPIPLLCELIEQFCPPGGIVVDPFAGSFATLEAARRVGRKGIGIEMEAVWCQAGIQRLQQTAGAW